MTTYDEAFLEDSEWHLSLDLQKKQPFSRRMGAKVRGHRLIFSR